MFASALLACLEDAVNGADSGLVPSGGSACFRREEIVIAHKDAHVVIDEEREDA